MVCLRAVGCDVEELDARALADRYPAFRVDEDVTAVFDPSSGIVHANRTEATRQVHARVALPGRSTDEVPLTAHERVRGRWGE